MLRVYSCVAGQHDLALVGLAIVICLLACHTAFGLTARARHAAGRQRLCWLMAAATVTGTGVWATHFVGMLAFQPALPVGYAVGPTALSVAIAIVATGAGQAMAIYRPALLGRTAPSIGGAVAGAAIGAMHFTGMAGMIVPARVDYNPAFIAAAMAVGITCGAGAFHLAAWGRASRRRIGAPLLFGLAIAGLHFTAMAGVTLYPDPGLAPARPLAPPDWLPAAIAAATALILAVGLAGSVIDQHLARRSAREAARLRSHVADLEAAQRDLQATTAALTAALDAAAAASQAKSQFLATMSHELRTPLNAVIGFAEMIAAEIYGPHKDPRYRDYAESIGDSGRHLLGLINDVLDFSKIDANQLTLAEETVDLGEALSGAAAMVRVQAAEAGLSLTTGAEAGLPPVRADARRLRQILLNLLSNAVKFTPSGGSVTVTATRVRAGRLPAAGGAGAAGRSGRAGGAAGAIAIAVTDTGIGIAEADIPRALERFGQVDGSLARRYEGTGLGLPLAKGLVELHGGTLTIESAVGKGTTVTVLLPAERVLDGGGGGGATGGSIDAA